MSRCPTAPFFFLLLPKQFSSSGGDFIFIFNFFPPFVPTGLIPHHLAFFLFTFVWLQLTPAGVAVL
jgi:hypothetical protein